MKPNIYRNLALALFAGLGLFIVLTFRQYGISNDEFVQHTYGRLLLDFYSSGFHDQSAFHYINLYLYGGFFDLIAAILERILPLWLWDMRHLLSALFGLGGIVAVYKMARLLGGERAGLVTAILLTLTGAWTGAMFTHTKDIPFATCMAWALYYTMRIGQELGYRRILQIPASLSIKLGIAVGCALGMRIGGIFAVIYLSLMLCLAIAPQLRLTPSKGRLLLDTLRFFLPAAAIAFVLMGIFWPWGVMSPTHPLEAAKAFSHFAFDMKTVMDGEVMRIGQVPRDYIPAYLMVRLPEVFLLGLAGVALFGWQQLRRYKARPQVWLPWAALLISIGFPLFFILFDRPALYNGIRHFTFLLPPLAVLAGLGLCLMWDVLRERPILRKGYALASISLATLAVVTLLRLHPYEYVYYNHLAGNLAHAEHAWEGDYWSSSLREAAHILESKVPGETEKGIGGGEVVAPYRVAVCAESIQGQAYLDHRFQITSDWLNADFFISSTQMGCDTVLQGRVIGTVQRLGAVLAVIKDRRTLLAHQRMPRPTQLTDLKEGKRS
ncbi:MAG TPA: glycosyltransferase family 39 protein [Methylophilaceae bacterium]|nr:glycosyltransferase family 39 protein [Methylophilaceae bacterium]